MSYEAEKKRLIEEFESVVTTIRKDWGVKGPKKSPDAKPAQQPTPSRVANRH